jgi:hypothetical protein
VNLMHSVLIIIIMLPNQAIASTPSAPHSVLVSKQPAAGGLLN